MRRPSAGTSNLGETPGWAEANYSRPSRLPVARQDADGCGRAHTRVRTTPRMGSRGHRTGCEQPAARDRAPTRVGARGVLRGVDRAPGRVREEGSEAARLRSHTFAQAL